MKYTLQLFGSLVFAVLAQQAMAACPSNLPAEKLIECIIAENDCLEGSSLQQNLASTPAESTTATIVENATTPQIDTLLANARRGNQ